MTWIDVLPITFLLIYVVLGFFTGVVRRGIGLIALYIACFAATNMGLQVAGVITGSFPDVTTPDARIYGFFGVLFAVVILLEGAAQLIHKQLELTTVALNRLLGVLVGLLTGFAVALVVAVELIGAASPEGGAELSSLQISVRNWVHDSKIAIPLANGIGKPITTLFKPVLPTNPNAYFGPGPVS